MAKGERLELGKKPWREKWGIDDNGIEGIRFLGILSATVAVMGVERAAVLGNTVVLDTALVGFGIAVLNYGRLIYKSLRQRERIKQLPLNLEGNK